MIVFSREIRRFPLTGARGNGIIAVPHAEGSFFVRLRAASAPREVRGAVRRHQHLSGGAEHESKGYIGMHRMQAEKLCNKKEQEE